MSALICIYIESKQANADNCRKLPEWLDKPGNQGDDIAGIVEAVGENVTEFKPGDRVGAFHEMTTSGGSYAEYAIAWQHTTFHLPKNTSFEGEFLAPS
jgi:NADPH:quinone reductase-like Zn-dependent oxidoreductase